MNEKQNTTDWQKLNVIFAEAIELATVEREVFLNRSCAGNENLRREVEAILSANSRAGEQNFLQSNVFTAGVRALAQSESGADLTGKRIGNYKIISEIGRGGMGAVYLAEREDFKRQVALKIIKRGMDTDDIVRRFERERQVLASLNHPNIAHLLDGGSTEDGLPFFVMEYVEGAPITEYCDRQKLNIEERLKLFRKVCAAVAYAHQNLIVHRDIKPSNILVDNLGEPKLLDFGISKLLASEASENTATEVRLMTPEYASPEQIRGEMITTVSDIYSLGVLLYELLSGHRPFKLKNRASAEILKIVSEEEPPAPSTAALTAEEIIKGNTREILSPDTIAEWRATNPPERLRRRLCGDLDNIVLMSLRKEPALRYSSVEQFSEDLRRHLEGLPVIARSTTFVYRFSKFVQRNRLPVAFAGLALLAILAGFSIAVWQAVVARQERARAEKQFHNIRQLTNRLLTEFDEEIRNLPGSYPTRIKLTQVSSEYLNALAQETNDPALLSELAEAHIRLGDAYAFHLENSEAAKKHLRLAIEISRRLVATAPEDMAAKELLAKSLDYRGGEIPAEKEQVSREIIRLREEIILAKPNDIQALSNLSEAYLSFGNFLRDAERRDQSLANYRLAVDMRKRQSSLLEKTDLTPEEYNSLFWAYLWIGIIEGTNFNDWETAVRNFYKADEISDAAAAKYPDNRHLQTNLYLPHLWLSRTAERQGDYRVAFEQNQTGVRLLRETSTRFNLFWQHGAARYTLKSVELLQKLGETDKALTLLREAIALRREASTVDHANPRTRHSHAFIFSEVGKLYASMRRFDEAIAAYREAETSWLAVLENNPHNADIRTNLANLYLRLGDLRADCQIGTTEIKAKNPEHLRQAQDFYRKSSEVFAKLESEKPLVPDDNENLRLSKKKIEICLQKLNGKS